MNLFRYTAPLLVLALAGVSLANPRSTMNYIDLQGQSKARKYHFVAWPKGSTKPFYFRSAIYTEGTEGEGATFVRTDDSKLFGGGSDQGVRRTADFDSLKASRVQPVFIAGSEYTLDDSWVTASVLGDRWVFPRLSGAVTLWSKAPGSGSYSHMDTGAGIEPYREAAVRRKIVSNPEAARLLHREGLGKKTAWGMLIGGGAVAATGAAVNIASSGSEANTLVLAGLGVAAISWVPHFMVQGHYVKAVRAYNAASRAGAAAAP